MGGQRRARAVVVGGGCVGASVLYALARRGWSDVVLLERTQLTDGSTWHAAGLVPTFTRQHSVGRMIATSLGIYEALEREGGYDVGWHRCGHLRVAHTAERMDEFRSYLGLAEAQGVEARVVTPDEVVDLWPLLAGAGVLGGLYSPDDGHIAPADLTHALAAEARRLGAEVHLGTEVTGFERRDDGWLVRTTRGDYECEHLVLATGNYARQTGAMVGLDLPAIPIVHQYWVTEPVPVLRERRAQGAPEMPILRDELFQGYLRQEGEGLLFGPYERPEHLKLFAVDGVPSWFGADLLPEDFAAVEDQWVAAAQVVPVLEETGLRSNVRGPFQMTADELPLAGPAGRGLENLWLAEGVPGGILWGGALGHHLAEWIVDGGTSVDMTALDPRRFGDHATRAWTIATVRRTWGTHPDVRHPDEDLAAGRPAKTAPSYDRLSAMGAVWGVLNGWEIPRWFADERGATQTWSFRRPPHAARVAEEVRAVRESVGLMEMTPMAKFEVSGEAATRWLDGVLANRLPAVGRIALCHHLTQRGTVLAEYTVTRLEEDLYYLVSSPRAERVNHETLTRLLPADGSVLLRNATMERGAFTIVGPRARDLLQPIVDTDLGNETFPWLSVRTASVGYAADVRLLRVTYQGELGWELYHPLGYQRHLLDLLLAQPSPPRPFGLEALESMRVEKSYRALHRELTTEDTALESGLGRFVRLDKDDFVGRGALLAQQETGLPRRLVTLTVEPGEGPLFGGEALHRDGQVVGRVTSGAWSYHLGQDLGLGFVDTPHAAEGSELSVRVLGELRTATVVPDSPYDPGNERCRA